MSQHGKPFIVATIQANTHITWKQAEQAYEAFITAIKTGTTDPGDKVVLKEFATFERVATDARTARNPATGAAIEIPAGSKVKIKAKY
jgi:DNA-binding protein HU-beta